MADARKQNEASQSAIDWQTFFHADNVPILGYDPVNDQIIIKRGADYGTFARGVTTATTSHDIYIYDMRTSSWTKSMNGLADNVDVTNFVVNGSSELVCKASDASTTTIYKWQPGPIATTTFKWRSKAFDFNYPALKKKLYKVIIHSKDGDYMDVNVYYDNKTSIGSAADGQAFDKGNSTLHDASTLTRNELTITTPTAFSYLTLEIVSDGTSSADFTVNDIALVYRVLRPH
jgi:hypothetical protein